MISRVAVAASLALALAACGSSNQPSEQATSTQAAPSKTPSPESAASEVAPSATPSAAPSATSSAAPISKAKASAATSADSDESATGASASPPQAFQQCAACHSTVPGQTIIGPSLAGVYGTKAGRVPGFQFSDAMKNSGLTWNAATLDRYLADPKSVVPGTLMSFAGLKDEDKREAVIAYLKTLK